MKLARRLALIGAGGRRGRRPGGHGHGSLGSGSGEAEADRVRHLRPAARLREGAGEAVRRPVRARRAGGRPSAADRRRAPATARAAPLRSRASTSRARTSRRKASTSRTSSRRTGRRSSPSRTGSCARSTSPVPKPRLLDSLALEPASSHELLLHGDRLLVLSRGGYWIEPLPAIAARIAPYQPAKSVLAEVDVSDPARLRLVRTLDARRLLRRRPARRLGRPDRRGRAAAGRAPVQAADRRLAGGDRRRQSGRTRPCVARSKVASWLPVLPDQARRREARQGAPARPVPPRPPPDRVLRPRHAHRPHRRPDEGPAARRLGRGDDRRPHRLRVPREPLRRHRALGRPARSGQADAGAGRRPDRDPQVRHLEPGEDAVPRQRQGLRLPAQPVVALRVPGRPPRRQHREPGVVGRRPRERVVPDHAAPVGRQRSSRRAGSAGSARASASTPCASSATPATSSPSARSIRSSRSTSRSPSGRACSAS